MSEKHIIVLRDLRATVKVTEHLGFIDMKYKFNRSPELEELQEFAKLNTEALRKWSSTLKPRKLTSNLSAEEKWIHALPGNILAVMESCKNKESTHE